MLLFFSLLLSGAVSGAAYAVSGAPFIIWLSIIPYFYIIIKYSPLRRAGRLFLYGLAFSCPYYLAVYHWFLYQYPLDFAGLSNAESLCYVLIAWIGISVLQALVLALVPVVTGFFAKTKFAARYRSLVLPFAVLCWCVVEWLQTKTQAALPWANLAVTQHKAVFNIQSASLFGALFVSFIILFTNACCAGGVLALKSGQKRRAAVSFVVGAAVFSANLIFGTVSYYTDAATERGETVTVSVLQGNLPSGEKWSGGVSAFGTYTELIESVGESFSPELIVLPETALPVNLQSAPAIYDRLSELAAQYDAVILAGAFDREDKHSYNAVFAFYPDGSVSQPYYKRHLVPFGEYLPLRALVERVFPALAELNLFSDDLTPGDSARVIQTEYGGVGALVCFDSIFGELAADSVRSGAELITISTNDSWFKDSAAITEHNGQAVLRAVECRRYIARSANTGMSSVITARGDISGSLGALLGGEVTAQAVMREDISLYAAHPRLFIFAVLCALSCMTAAAVTYPRLHSSPGAKKDKSV